MPSQSGKILGTCPISRRHNWRSKSACKSLHQLHELPVAAHHVVPHLIRGDLGEELSRAFNLGLFDFSQVHREHGAFCFRDEEDVLHFARLESNGPVGIVVSNRRRNMEAPGKLGVHNDFRTGIEFADESSLVCRVGEHVIIDVARRFETLAQVFLLRLGEYIDGMGFVEGVVGKVFDDDGCLLLVDDRAGLQEKVFWVRLELAENGSVDFAQDGGDSPARL